MELEKDETEISSSLLEETAVDLSTSSSRTESDYSTKETKEESKYLSKENISTNEELKEEITENTKPQEDNAESISLESKEKIPGVLSEIYTKSSFFSEDKAEESDSSMEETEEENPKELESKDKTKSSSISDEAVDDKTNELDSSIKENKEDKPGDEYDPKNVHYEGETAIYTDPKSGYQYKWCNETNEWLTRSEVTYGFEDDTHTYKDADGVKYFWDKEKKAWFPKIDDEFMARYQMNYGFIDNTSDEKEDKDKDKKKEDKNKKKEEKSEMTTDEIAAVKEKGKSIKRKAEAPPTPTWFEMDDQQNTKVYVNNLPTNITEEEFVDLMQKCGLVMRDAQSGKMKIKLYTVPETDILKGDALCTYIKIESVELALNLLDGYLYHGKRLSVERAKFQMKGEYNPGLKPKKKRRKDKDKIKKMQEKLFDWRPEKMRGERSKHERVVIVKNLFEPSLFDTEVSLILEFQQDLREECSKCGEVKRVVLYDRHPEGVVQISMKHPEEADEVVNLLNGRWFNKRQLTAEIWDGKTKFKIAETDAQISKRLETWEEFLESEETADKLKASTIELKTPENITGTVTEESIPEITNKE